MMSFWVVPWSTRRLDPVLLRHDDVERQQPRRRRVDRHRRVHAVERDAVHQRVHVALVRDRHADLADLAARELVIGVVARLRRQVEGDGEPRLALGQVAPVELIGPLRGGMARVGPHHPRAVGLGQAMAHERGFCPIALTRAPESGESRSTAPATTGGQRMTRRTLVAALAAAVTLLAPAAAQAGPTITWTQQRITVTTDGAGDVISLSTRAYVVGGEDVVFPAFPTDGSITYSPEAATAPNGCIDQIDASYIVCDPTDSFLFQGGGGSGHALDRRRAGGAQRAPRDANGGGGNDNLQDFSPAPRTLDGGDGNDVMFGSGGDDTLRGGNGNDEVDGEDGNDNVSGGDGDDKLLRRPLQGAGRRRDRRRARLRPRHRRLPRRPGRRHRHARQRRQRRARRGERQPHRHRGDRGPAGHLRRQRRRRDVHRRRVRCTPRA